MSHQRYIVTFIGFFVAYLSAVSAATARAAQPIADPPATQASAAAGAPSSIPTNPYTLRAQSLFQTGLEAFTQGDYSSACDAWEVAYGLTRKAELKFDLGLAYARLGLYKESTAAFAEYALRCAEEAAACEQTSRREIEPNPYRL